jgi:hypothetical protein
MTSHISVKPGLPGRSAGVVKLPDDERSRVAAELAAARDLFRTFDPDSPPWSIEPEMRRLERRWQVLSAGDGHP